MQAATVKFIYNVVFAVLLLLLLPWLITRMLRRGHWKTHLSQRFGRFDASTRGRLAQGRRLWLHAVSVGEVNLVVRLAAALQERLPDVQLVVSTTTTTGMGELRRQLPDTVEKVYYPLDLRGWVRRSLLTVRPEAIVLVEAEIWPNFLWESQRLGIPVLLVNARISERSARRYRRMKSVFTPLFSGLQDVCCASKTDADRLHSVGCRSAAIHVVGHLKFDLAAAPAEPHPEVERVLAAIGVTPERPLLLGGSTHPGEEKLLGQAFRSLLQRFPDLVLVVVPRHFERAPEAIRDLQSLGLKVARRSELSYLTGSSPTRPEALVVDSTGELRAFYAHATVVVIGKSWVAQGGQNPIEPAALARAIVTGPHMQNFSHVMEEFLRAEAVLQVPDASHLTHAIASLLADDELRNRLGHRAQQVVQSGRGALDRTADAVVATWNA